MGLGQSYDKWQNDKPSTVPSAVLASGPETELKEECLDTLRELFDEAPEEVTFYADESSPEEVIQEVRGRGLFNDSKIVVLKHLERNASGHGYQMARYQSVIQDYLDDPGENVLLYLMDRDHPYQKSRQTGAVARAVDSAGGESIIFWEPFDNSLREYVQTAFAEAGMSIHPPAVQVLLKRTRGKFSRVKREAQKLVDSLNDPVTEDDVRNFVTREEASDGFQALKESIVNRDPEGLMTDFEDLWHRGEAPPKVFYVVFSFLHSIREVKQLRSEGESLESALSNSGLPSNQSVKKLFKRATKPGALKISRDFYRESYETNKEAKYVGSPLDRRSVEVFALNFLRGSR